MAGVQKIAVFYLVLMAIVYAAFGLWCLVNPLMLAHEFGYTLTIPDGANEFRAAYGGQFILVGVFLYIGGNYLSWQRPALLLLGLQLSGFALGRVITMLVDGVSTGLHLMAFVGESVCATIALVLFFRLGKMQKP